MSDGVSSEREALEGLVGKRIASVNRTEDDKYIRMAFDDGTACEFSGLGYDGLWDDVVLTWYPKSALPGDPMSEVVYDDSLEGAARFAVAVLHTQIVNHGEYQPKLAYTACKKLELALEPKGPATRRVPRGLSQRMNVGACPDIISAEELARRFHRAYERLAPEFDYETRRDSAVPWEQVPEQNKRLMIAVCAELLSVSPGSLQGEKDG